MIALGSAGWIGWLPGNTNNTCRGKELRSTISKLAWFASRPQHWGDLPTLIRRHTFPDRRDIEVAEAKAEYERLAIALEDVGQVVPGFVFTDFRKAHAAECEAASTRCGPMLLPSGGGCLELIHGVSEAIGATRVIETGVAYGWSSLAFLLSLDKRGGRLVSVDRPYPGLNVEIVGLAVPDRLRSNWTLLRQSDRVGLPMALQTMPEIDLCHYDSDKSYMGHFRTLPLLWNALRSGGIMLCDDASDNAGFLDFSRQLVGRDPVIVRYKGKHIGLLTKD